MELVVKRFEELTNLELYEILKVRESVFVVEQACPYQEVDGKDLYSFHVFYREGNQIQAYLRVVAPTQNDNYVSIGRVLTVSRNCGFGKKIMLEGIRTAKEYLSASNIYLEAQSYAKRFYEQIGFEQVSKEFLEDNIPHIKMQLLL